MLVSQKVTDLLGGVSQQAQEQRTPNRLTSQVNGLSSLVRGLTKRPSLQHVAKLATTLTGWSSAFLHSVNRSESERYVLAVVNGDLKAFDALTGSELTVEFPDGKGYLADSGGNGFRAVTIGDETVLVNRGVVPKKGSTKPAGRSPEALIFVRQADFGVTYTVTLEGREVSYSTPQATSNLTEVIDSYRTARELQARLQRDSYINAMFSFERLGSWIYVTRANGEPQDFSITVADSLSGQGLRLVKGKVQYLEDLPYSAKDGMLVEVAGDPNNDRDSSWYQFVAGTVEPALGQAPAGVWEEVSKPGEVVDLDASTLPHRIVRSGSVIPKVAHVAAAPYPTMGPGGTNYQYADTDTYNGPGSAFVLSPAELGTMEHNSALETTSTTGMFDGTERVLTVRYRVASNTSVGEHVSVVLEIDGLAVATKNYPASAVSEYDTISYVGDIATDAVIGLRFLYSSGATEGSVVAGGYSYLVRDAFEANGNVSSAVPSGAALTFNADVFYPDGKAIELTLDGVDIFTFTPTGDDTAADVAAGLAALVDAHASYTASSSSNVLTILPASGAAAITATLDMSFNASTVFYSPLLSLVTNELAGKTLRNLTDGSTGTIASNSSVSIVVSALTGGADNTFSAGDVIDVVGSGTYLVFEECPWNERESGDDVLCPFPSFIGSPINEVFFFGGRLGFVSGESVVLSRAGDKFNLFRKTAVQLLADDPIDVKAAHADVSQFHSAVVFDSKLYLFSTLGQFILSGEPALSPQTVKLDAVSRYPSTGAVRPVVFGNKLFFPRARSGFTQVFEYMSQRRYEELVPPALDLNVVAPSFIPGTPLSIVGDSALELVALATNSTPRNAVYVFAYHEENFEKFMASWSRWEFPSGTEVLGMDMVDGFLYVMTKHADGVYLGKVDLTVNLDQDAANVEEKVKYLDRRLDETEVTPAFAGGDTTWTLPYSVPVDGSEGDLVVVNRSTGVVYTTTRPSATQVRVAGLDLSAAEVYIGIPVEFSAELSTLYLRGEKGPEVDGRLQLRYLEVLYRDSTDLTVTAAPFGRSAKSYALAVSVPQDGVLRLPVFCRNKDTTLTLSDSTPGVCSVLGIEWEGFFNKRNRSL